MNKIQNPLFKAYVSIDIENPVNTSIYELREALSDKKMTAMPVDIPLFGHFDNKMTLMRHYSELNDLMSFVLETVKEMDFEQSEYTLKSDHFELTTDGKLMIVFKKNKLVTTIMKLIIQEAHSRSLNDIVSLESIKDFERNFNNQFVIYIMQKTYVEESDAHKYSGKKNQLGNTLETTYLVS